MNGFLKEMPYAEQAEIALLGACLVHDKSLSTALEKVKEDYFYVRHHPNIWNAIVKTHAAGKEVSHSTIASYFPDETRQKYIREIGVGVLDTSEKQVEFLIERLRDRYQRRELRWKIEAILDGLESDDPDDTAVKYMEELDGFLYELNEAQEIKGPNLNGMTEALKSIETAMNNGGVIGVSTGYNSLDNILGGFAKQDLIIVAGRPSMGKTSLALCIAETIQENVPTLFCSLEMSAEQISCKRLSLRTDIPTTKMREGKLQPVELQKLVEHSKPGNLWIDDTPALTPDQLLSRARRLKKSEGLGLIVVDYLQLMQASRDAQRQGSVQATTEISKKLKAIAKDLDVPVVALSQLSRAVEQRENKRPMLSDLRESGAIEQDADSVCFVYRDEYYLERDMPSRYERESDEKWSERLNNYHTRLEQAKGKAEVIVAKNRHGKIGTAVMEFIGETTKFAEIVDE